MRVKIYLLSLILLSFLLGTVKEAAAITDPLSVPNNQYGIHIIDENDLNNAAKLVNSSGGDWGYVTLVIADSERKVSKWQSIFNKLNELHLIPIVRLATTLKDDMWEKPHPVDSILWANFLSQLNWFTKNRYIILFNEPNHAKEWGGEIDPEGYFEVLKSFSAALKSSSQDYFILPAGLDASSPNSFETMDEVNFLKKIIAVNSDFFSYIDGWTSHSYPNPGFVGGVYNSGRGTLKTYQWELKLLQQLGLTKKLPVFITETGWPHAEGSTYNKNYYTSQKVSDLIKFAGENIWTGKENIVAITPFILNYQSLPFSNFSWALVNSNDFYPQYYTYQSIQKTKGQPLLVSPTPTPEQEVLGTQDIDTTKKSSLSQRLALLISAGIRIMFSYLIKT